MRNRLKRLGAVEQHAVLLCLIQEATERGVELPGIRDLDRAEQMACYWLEHYERNRVPLIGDVDELTNSIAAKLWPRSEAHAEAKASDRHSGRAAAITM